MVFAIESNGFTSDPENWEDYLERKPCPGDVKNLTGVVGIDGIQPVPMTGTGWMIGMWRESLPLFHGGH